MFNLLTRTIMLAEHALHTTVPLNVVNQGEEAILAFCDSYDYTGKYAKDLVKRAKQTS